VGDLYNLIVALIKSVIIILMKYSRAKSINLIVAGGSGLWTEKNHYSAILSLKEAGLNVKVVTICDPINPNRTEKQEKRDNLKRILKIDNPLWINPAGKNFDKLTMELNQLKETYGINALIVSIDPIHHYFYCKWALCNKINLLCDKPLVTAQDSSFNPNQAQLIEKWYEELNNLYTLNKKENPFYIFCSPLRRRALTPFIMIANELNRIYLRTSEGIRYMNVIVNGGIHKYPSEYLKSGAHSHLDGIGTLSHSSYHYIDVIAWYLKMARGNIDKIEISLPYILRVGEYLKTNNYKKLRELIESESKKFDDNILIPQEVLNSELDFSFYLKLKDKEDNQVGLISFIVNYSTYTPRLVRYNPEVTEYAHHKLGGRMSSVYFDIHQGALQQWQLIKNDEAAFDHNIEIKQYLHPKLGKKIKKMSFSNSYESETHTPKDLFKSFIKICMKQKIPKKHLSMLSLVDDQKLTNRLYSMMYEKIAEEFYNKTYPHKQIKLHNIIKLDNFL